jgi:hypothetical protein
LYPDPLLAELLPAATFPGDIVLASRYLGGGGDPMLVDLQGWDPSVAALSRYPEVIEWMDENLSWTMALGETFLNQPEDVLDSIQRLRARAQMLGNLQSSLEEMVINENGLIEILPPGPESIYLPVYDSQVIYIHSTTRPSVGRKAKTGSWLTHDFDWRGRQIIVWSQEQQRPAGWWSYSSSQRHCLGEVHPRIWQRHHHLKADRMMRVPGQSAAGVTQRISQPASTVTTIGGKSTAPSIRSSASGASHGGTITAIGASKGGSSGISSQSKSASSPASGTRIKPATANRAPAPAPAPAR